MSFYRQFALARVFVSLICIFCGAASLDASEQLPPGVKVIHSVPLKERDVAAAFDLSRAQTCQQVPPEEQLEVSVFTPQILEGLAARGKTFHDIPVPTCRRNAFSLGLDVSRADQSSLPLGSATLIMSYIDQHYVLIGARVHRDLIDNELYISSRPVAAVALYRGARQTQEFVETTAAAVNNMRGYGMFMKEGEKATPENIRTAVMIHKDSLANDDPVILGSRIKPNYELVILRARPAGAGDRKALELHAFVTSEKRENLNYLRNAPRPGSADECSIKGTIVFTEYRFANRIPAASATRRSSFRNKERFTMAELDAFASKSGWTGSAFDNLTELLDAIIDNKISK